MSSIFFDAAPTSITVCWLFLALFVALGFEFVNGFNDTANAVATVIYTKSLRPAPAVLLAGLLNFLGVLVSGVAVAYSIVNLFPVDMVEAAGTAGFTMVFSVIFGAILWNLTTWYLGLPNSSSHALIGAIIGVGLVHSAVTPGMKFGDGVHWGVATTVGAALFISPLIGFGFSALLLWALKAMIKNPAIHRSPDGPEPPPNFVRAILILGCAGVSFAHGSNDGQKGMGLLMLILIGLVPGAFALNMAIDAPTVQACISTSVPLEAELTRMAGDLKTQDETSATAILTDFVRDKKWSPAIASALAFKLASFRETLGTMPKMTSLPADKRWNLRASGMLLLRVLRTIQFEPASAPFTPEQMQINRTYKRNLKAIIEYVCPWVKAAVALALGLGTMVGWKRIVVTVGEKIGRTRMTYSQGAAAQSVAVVTILAADLFGMPVSTTHILSSGVAGTMFANRSGLQRKTLNAIILAWLLTLPVCTSLSALLFLGFRLL